MCLGRLTPIKLSKLVFFEGTRKEFGLWYALLAISPLLSWLDGLGYQQDKELTFSDNPLINHAIINRLGDLDKVEQEEWNKMKAKFDLPRVGKKSMWTWWIFGFQLWGDLRPAEMRTAQGARYIPLMGGIWIRR